MKLKSLLDITKLLKQLDKAEVYEDEDGNKTQTVYLGDIRSITPSGKVYMPFACSNLTPCPRCNGTTQIENKHYKKKKWMKIHNKRKVLFLNAINQCGHFVHWPEKIHQKINKLLKQENHWTQWLICPECIGLGSLEARLDQDFWKQLGSELDTIEAWHHSSEGDGCQVMVSRGVEICTQT